MRRTLMISAALTALASGVQAQDAEVSEVVVTGRAQQLYRSQEAQVGRLPTPPLESSQAVQVINAELIADQGARDAQDLYRSISGVSFFSYAGVTARGFRQEEIFFDGLRGDPYAGFSVPQLFNVERVEFLKGPAGMLYGPGAPGGLFNYVTKKAEDPFSAKVSAVVGTEARYGASAEINGALPAEGVAGRLGAFYEEQNTPRVNARSEILILDGGLKFDLPVGELNLQATYYDQNLPGNRLRGVPTDNLGVFLTDRRWNHNEPDDFLRLEASVVQASWAAQVSDSLTLNAALRYTEGLETQKYHEPFGLADTDGDGVLDTSRRQYRDQVRDQSNWSAGANLIWTFDLAGVESRLLAGADWFTNDLEFQSRGVNGTFVTSATAPTPLSLFNPVYDVTPVSNYALPAYTVSLTESDRAGGYLLYEATVGNLIGTVGARYDSFEDVSGAAGFEDEALTWRTGLVYRVRPDVSVYGQWAQSFEPQGSANQTPLAGGPFDPTEGEMFEGGLKTELMGGRVQGGAAVYHITRTNILQADPRGDVGGDGVNDLVAFGEITSKGLEIDVAADVTPNWVVTTSYAYNDTRITADNGRTAVTNSVGDRFANAPEHTVGFWTRYQFPDLGLAVALGGDYVDVRRSLSDQKVRPYLVFDASIIYTRGPWRTLLRIDNLTDEVYAASGFTDRTGHFPGAPRSVFLELSRAW
ncbi:MAG: TonB-dependent receptor [Phenylobacterium sp.]|uniref:TonB-dependent siderophore receptor n=1 Tax=Phenylobacterium sp. TaxID=1871053 RepID=UPI002716E481|nr:TonB-dependent receptor [Phenylobacterium sp.]MDO8409043.1 TonB-dependent receptor [Phenylobacterium sp.]